MTAITINEAKENLGKNRSSGAHGRRAGYSKAAGEQVVVLPLEDFDSWKETICLLSNPASVNHLRESLEEVRAGRVEEKELLDV